MVAFRGYFVQVVNIEVSIMAKCEICGKKPMFGNTRSHSMKATRRQFKPNLQRIRVWKGDARVRMTLCAKCIKTMAKT
jgi:large subunit ribosomal protein L28